MTIYQLECFIAVAEELNFSAAAERLFTTQPVLNRSPPGCATGKTYATECALGNITN